MRSGLISINAGYIGVAGVNGYYRSGSGHAAGTAYYSTLFAIGVGPSAGPDDRRYGFSLRCLQE